MDTITEKSTDKRLKNLRPAWKKGDPSPNPKGKPKGQRSYADIYKDALIKLGEINNKTPDELETELIASGFASAKKDYRFYKDVLDRLHGTPVQKSTMEITLPKPIADVFVNNGIQDSQRNEEDSELEEKN